MLNSQSKPSTEIDLPSIDDIDLSDKSDQPKPEPIVTKKPYDNNELPQKKSHKTLYIILSILGTIIAISGVVSWLFVFNGIYNFQGLPLTDYSNSQYSMKVPVGYVKTQNNLGASGTDVTFTDQSEKVIGTQSKVYIASGEKNAIDKSKYLKDLDRIYSANNIKKSQTHLGVNGSADIRYSKVKVKGMEARILHYVITDGKNRVGDYNKLMLFSDEKIYEIVVSAPNSNPGLLVDAQKIFDSFTLK